MVEEQYVPLFERTGSHLLCNLLAWWADVGGKPGDCPEAQEEMIVADTTSSSRVPGPPLLALP